MVKELYQLVDYKGIAAKDITLPRGIDNALYISENGKVLCYLGVWIPSKSDIFFRCSPFYIEGKHSKKFEDEIKGYFRLEKGCILIDRFIDQQFNKDEKYKKMDKYIIRLPVSSSCYFGVEKVIKDNQKISFEEDPELTREVFGLTWSELEHLLEAYAEIFGICNDYMQYPRITRSVKNDNTCDLTGLWIPPQFPYITFTQSSYDFSHVSLFGFYRYLKMLLFKGKNSSIYKALIKKPFTDNIIKRVLEIQDYFPIGRKAVWKEMLTEYYKYK